jgi:hypothetical protein
MNANEIATTNFNSALDAGGTVEAVLAAEANNVDMGGHHGTFVDLVEKHLPAVFAQIYG